MNKTQLQQKIVDMEKQLAELKKELEKKDKGIWKPEEEGKYYYIDAQGLVVETKLNNWGRNVYFLSIGNYYKTEEEALKMANYLKYTNLLRKYVEEHSEPIDWEDGTKKYFIYCTNQPRALIIDYDYYRYQGTIYASSEEVLLDAIEFVGEENIKKYIFGIEE